MADQDKAPSYDAGLPQKPINLDSKVPMQLVRKSCPKHGEDSTDTNRQQPAPLSNGGYYFNVAQKGKLILPTTLWILLIIAGISFLTLLVSLNKTINTLDTLVELEQEKEARALVSEHLHHRQLDKQFKLAERLNDAATPARHPKGSSRNEMKAHESAASLHHTQPDDLFVPTFEPSWFSMPSWTSLEPVRQHSAANQQHQQQQQPPRRHASQSPMSVMEELMRDMPQSADMIIVQEGPLLGGHHEQHRTHEPVAEGLFGSLMRQVSPLLEQLMRSDKQEPELEDEDDDELPPMISAKIDNVNVHINSAPQAPETKKSKPSREEEIGSLEKSIDDLVSKLTGQRMPPMPPRKSHAMDFQVGEMMPPMAHHKRPPVMSPFSPLASLLLPPAHYQDRHPAGDRNKPHMPFSSQTIEFTNDNANPLQHGEPGFPMGDSLIISISDDGRPAHPMDDNKPSRETNRHQVSNTRRPLFSGAPRPSPYEFSPFDSLFVSPFEMMSTQIKQSKNSHPDHHVTKAGGKQEDPEWDSLANDLAQALVEDMMSSKHKEAGDKKNKKPNNEQPQEILVIGSVPGEKQNSVLPPVMIPPSFVDLNLPQGKKENIGSPSDLLSLVLGPLAPNVVVEDVKPASSKPQSETTTSKPAIEMPVSQKTATPQQTPSTASVAADPIVLTMSSSEPTMSPKAKADVDSLISQLPGLSPAGDEKKAARNEPDDVLGDFVSTMFSLPQMGGNQQQASTGGAKSASDSGASDPNHDLITLLEVLNEAGDPLDFAQPEYELVD